MSSADDEKAVEIAVAHLNCALQKAALAGLNAKITPFLSLFVEEPDEEAAEIVTDLESVKHVVWQIDVKLEPWEVSIFARLAKDI
jgi:hypothetical protein